MARRRWLARKLGVSHNAPYMHFADKEALLAAVAQEGFHLLSEAITAAVASAGDDWRARLESGSRAYVAFMLDHPGHAQVMFHDYDMEKYPDLFVASTGALALLEQVLNAGKAAGHVAEAANTRTWATLMWSMMHGLATILAARRMPPAVMGDTTPDALIAQYLDALLVGLRPRPE